MGKWKEDVGRDSLLIIGGEAAAEIEGVQESSFEGGAIEKSPNHQQKHGIRLTHYTDALP